jgi:hypothetical protein
MMAVSADDAAKWLLMIRPARTIRRPESVMVRTIQKGARP